MALTLPPLTIRDQALRQYLEMLVMKINWIEANCCCGCGGHGGGSTPGAPGGSGGATTIEFGQTHPGGMFFRSGMPQPAVSIYDLSGNTTLSSAEINRTHYINATTTLDVTLPHMEIGQFVTIVNTGSSTITIKDETGATVTTVTPGGISEAHPDVTGVIISPP